MTLTIENEKRSWLRLDAIPVKIFLCALCWAGVVILFEVG
jgi:hypothetical protein